MYMMYKNSSVFYCVYVYISYVVKHLLCNTVLVLMKYPILWEFMMPSSKNAVDGYLKKNCKTTVKHIFSLVFLYQGLIHRNVHYRIVFFLSYYMYD